MSIRKPLQRRLSLVGGGVLACVVVLSGCSGDAAPEQTDAPESGADAQPAGEGVTQYPLTLTTDWGETILEKRPERIVLAGSYGPEDEVFCALDVAPVATVHSRSNNAWMDECFAGADMEIIEADSDAIPLEAIASYDPDLIIAYDLDLSTGFKELASIAPVVSDGISHGGDQSLGSWRDRVLQVGEVLDISGTAEAVLDEYDTHLEAIREDYPQFAGKTIAHIMYYGKGNGLLYINRNDTGPAEFYESMGFAENDAAELFSTDDTEWVSEELMGKIDADVILFMNSTAHEAVASEIVDNPLFQGLEAVKSGHLVELDNTGDGYVSKGEEHPGNLAMALAQPGPISLSWAMDIIATLVAEKVE